MSKKKIISLCLVVCLLATAIGSTLAYFTDTAKNTNTMTLGNVDIAQWEYERELNEDGSYKTDTIDGQNSYVLTGFTQDKPLLPIVGDPSTGDAGWDQTTVRMSKVGSYGGMRVFAGKNAQDKFVVVENTGKTDAYVRTLVAIECGDTDGDLIGVSYHTTWEKNDCLIAEINGNNYLVIEYVYQGAQLSDGSWRHAGGALKAGQMAYPSLSQVYLKAVATNEDMTKLDGNKNGKLDILVLSQAVQAAGFENAQTALDTAFGVVDATNVAEWFK